MTRGKYVIRGTAGDSRTKAAPGVARNRALMREHDVKVGERRRRHDGRVLTVLGPSEHALPNGAVSVRFDDGEQRTLYPATVAMMELEAGRGNGLPPADPCCDDDEEGQ